MMPNLQKPLIEVVDDNTWRPEIIGGFRVHRVSSPEDGAQRAATLLGDLLSRRSLLMLSYNEKLHPFYHLLLQIERREPLAIMMADEVFGTPYHLHSCEHFLRKMGFIDAISKKGVPFFRILSRSPTLGSTVKQYTKQVASLMSNAQDTHVIVEIGDDGSLGGIMPACHGCPELFQERGPLYNDHMIGFTDTHLSYSPCERISMSYKTLQDASHIWAFSYGDANAVVERLFSPEPMTPQDTPAVFLRQFRNKVNIISDLAVL